MSPIVTATAGLCLLLVVCSWSPSSAGPVVAQPPGRGAGSPQAAAVVAPAASPSKRRGVTRLSDYLVWRKGRLPQTGAPQSAVKASSRSDDPPLPEGEGNYEDDNYYGDYEEEDDGVYDLADLQYNLIDYTDRVAEGMNATFLAKLKEVNQTISDLERRLAEKDEEILALREEFEGLGVAPKPETKDPTLGDVQLINKVTTATAVEGRLLFYAGTELGWGYVCDDLFYTASAIVACRQLGYSRGAVNFVPDFSSLLQLTNTNNHLHNIVLDDVQCRHNDTDLLSCPHEPVGVHNCLASQEAVNLVCYL